MDIIKFFHHLKGSNPVDVSNWQTFDMASLFYIDTGASISKALLVSGDMPRISVTASENGIIGRYMPIENKKYRTFTNFISYSFLGTCFYHPYKASVDMKVHTLIPKDIVLNPYIGLFLVAVLRKMWVADYNNQISKEILKKSQIILPEKDVNPDWQFMEDYIKSLPYSSNL